MAVNKPVNINDDEFEEKVLSGDGLIVVDFWAPWCGPCHSMAPALEAFAEENADKLEVFKLDVDDNPKTAERYKITGVPTIMFFRDGEKVDANVGAMSQASLQAKIDELEGK